MNGKTSINSILALMWLLMLSACSSNGTSDIQVRNAWVRPVIVAMPEANIVRTKDEHVTVAYLTIENQGSASDRLISVSSDAASIAEIYKSLFDEHGLIYMQAQPDGIEIPAHSSIQFEPDNYNIMLFNLRKPLKTGETISLTLRFTSGQITMIVALVSDSPPEEEGDRGRNSP